MKLFRLMTGVPLTPNNPLFEVIINLPLADAAKKISDGKTGAKEYYDRVGSLAEHWNPDHEREEPNHFSANLVGWARDNRPYSTIFWENIAYYDPTKNSNANGYLQNNTEHYRQVFQANAMTLLKPLAPPGIAAVGFLNRFPLGNRYLSAGTNRRPEYFFVEHLGCMKVEALKSTAIPDYYVNIDPARFDNAGNGTLYQTECRSCHGRIDAGVKRAYARYDFIDGQVTYGNPANKVNANVWPTRKITDQDWGWRYFITADMNAVWQFPGMEPLDPQGTILKKDGLDLAEYGKLFGSSRRVHECLCMHWVSLLALRKRFSVRNYSANDHELLRSQQTLVNRCTDLLMSSGINAAFEAVAVEIATY